MASTSAISSRKIKIANCPIDEVGAMVVVTRIVMSMIIPIIQKTTARKIIKVEKEKEEKKKKKKKKKEVN